MTTFDRITNWDDAYANRKHAPGADQIIDAWPSEAASYRTAVPGDFDCAYAAQVGQADRHLFDLWQPEGPAKGLFVFVHGGYWMTFDKSTWSPYGAGALAAGWAVAIPSYTLTPNIALADIRHEIAAAINAAAARVAGPIILSGHSAGGHLVSRMVCDDSPLPAETQARVRHVLSISGVHDLRPLLQTELNQTLGMSAEEAKMESPALRRPVPGARLTCLVGGDERPEFIRQSALLASAWLGLGASTRLVVRPGQNHFTVIDSLKQVDPLLFDGVIL